MFPRSEIQHPGMGMGISSLEGKIPRNGNLPFHLCPSPRPHLFSTAITSRVIAPLMGNPCVQGCEQEDGNCCKRAFETIRGGLEEEVDGGWRMETLLLIC